MASIDQFMWGFQPHFRISASVRAESLFSALDSALDPQVLLVGRLEEEREDRHPLCVEPEDGEILLDALSGLDDHVAAAMADDPESSMFQTHPRAELHRQQRVTGNGFSNGVARALNGARSDRVFFASFPQRVDSYLVTTVLHMDRAAYEQHVALNHREYLHRFTVPTSLLDATVRDFLGDCSSALRDPSVGEISLPELPVQDQLRRAGRSLLDNPGLRLGEIGNHPRLFDRFCEVAALRYEGAEGRGRLILTGPSHSGADVVLALAKPVPFSNPRSVRKLLEMASESMCALATPQGIYGLGRVEAGHDHEAEDVFTVTFLGSNAWVLGHAERPLMRVQDGVPALPQEPIARAAFDSVVGRVFEGIADVDVDCLWRSVVAARQQAHGTLLVFSSGAEAEAARLAAQSTVVDPVPLSSELVSAITAIDGAVLADPQGTCHAIGVILDGMAVGAGDPGRGARYNSALRYVETASAQFGHKVLALVVSEDGMVNLVPALRPQVPRSHIAARMDTLRALAADEAPSRTILVRAEDWLRRHRFYLDATTCEEINHLVTAIDAKRDEDEGAVRIIRAPFEPDPAFDESYLLDE